MSVETSKVWRGLKAATAARRLMVFFVERAAAAFVAVGIEAIVWVCGCVCPCKWVLRGGGGCWRGRAQQTAATYNMTVSRV